MKYQFRMGPGMGFGNDYVYFARWAIEQVQKRHSDLMPPEAKLDRESFIGRQGELVYVRQRGTAQDGSRFELTFILKLNSPDQEDLEQLQVVSSGGCIWWVPPTPVNTELLSLWAKMGVDLDTQLVLTALAAGEGGVSGLLTGTPGR